MFEEDVAGLEAKAQLAQQVTSLSTLLDYSRALAPLRALELAATDSNDRTKAILAGLGKHAAALMTTALRAMDRQVADIERQANEVLQGTVNAPDPANPGRTVPRAEFRKRGLDGDMRARLDRTIADCQRLPAAAQELVYGFSADTAPFDAPLQAAKQVWQRAVTVRDTDYGNDATNVIRLH